MPTTTVLHEYEKYLKERLEMSEIVESTFNSYLNDASRVFEVLLRHLPANVIQGYMKEEGYRRNYRHIIETLQSMARPRRSPRFKHPQEGQIRLPGV